MKRITTAGVVALCIIYASTAMAQTATQDVTIIVDETNAISTSAGTVTLTINAATAGSDPDDATDASTTYNITTNGSSKKITGQLTSDDYSTGITLKVTLAAPTGAASTGEQTLANVAAVDLVTGISLLKQTGLSISYTASATVDVAPTSETETVTYTITGV